MARALYLDTSAVLRALVETGRTPEIEDRIRTATFLVTSRLTVVEAARVLLRLRQLSRVPEEDLADAAREVDELWARCDLWELTPAVCDIAAHVAPAKPLRTLDALHLATYLLARRSIANLELLTADKRLREAATTV
jgi:predicted nucleic acid-binding protein